MAHTHTFQALESTFMHRVSVHMPRQQWPHNLPSTLDSTHQWFERLCPPFPTYRVLYIYKLSALRACRGGAREIGPKCRQCPPSDGRGSSNQCYKWKISVKKLEHFLELVGELLWCLMSHSCSEWILELKNRLERRDWLCIVSTK